MSFTRLFEHDTQFMRLVRRESDVDLVTAALEIARDGQGELTFEPSLRRLKDCVAQLTHPVAMAGSDLDELRVVIRYLTDELNLHGDDTCFTEPEASYLNCVLSTGRGLPISLSIIYVAIANNLGIPLEPIAAPAHFLTRLQTDTGRLYIDAFDRGRIMQEDECLEWLHDVTELPMPEISRSMKPASERAIVIRMLHNLKVLFGTTERWASAWKVQNRLALLNPGSYRARRDLAILTLRAGRAGEAIEQLERCLAVCAPDERPVLQQHLKQARREAPQWN